MTTPDDERVTYRFHLARGIEEITLRFDPKDFSLRRDAAVPDENWTRLEFQKCGHCPLSVEQHPHCPFAQAMAGFVTHFDEFYSYDEAVIEVITASRTVVSRKPLQRGMASLLGLIGATSGCPHLDFFRPMARYHLPFAGDNETLYRVFSMHLLGCFLRGQFSGQMSSLTEYNRAANIVNVAMAERLRAAVSKDVMLNAVIVLDCFAHNVPYVIEDQLDELRPVFGLG